MSRNYTLAQKAEIQKRLTELVRTHGRMTFGELRKITGLTIFYSPPLPGKSGKLWGSVSGREKRYFPFGTGFPALEAET
ncbi:phage encoded DNA-binding protein [Salmonella enterica subsp. enterica serovar Newport str. RI_10P069]|nr:phage encoded DNA-binding protein [Salmonella enterica subsp. enterica serovar Newport str. RI_10P069]